MTVLYHTDSVAILLRIYSRKVKLRRMPNWLRFGLATSQILQFSETSLHPPTSP